MRLSEGDRRYYAARARASAGAIKEVRYGDPKGVFMFRLEEADGQELGVIVWYGRQNGELTGVGYEYYCAPAAEAYLKWYNLSAMSVTDNERAGELREKCSGEVVKAGRPRAPYERVEEEEPYWQK